jgi:hypothetical protein
VQPEARKGDVAHHALPELQRRCCAAQQLLGLLALLQGPYLAAAAPFLLPLALAAADDPSAAVKATGFQVCLPHRAPMPLQACPQPAPRQRSFQRPPPSLSMPCAARPEAPAPPRAGAARPGLPGAPRRAAGAAAARRRRGGRGV